MSERKLKLTLGKLRELKRVPSTVDVQLLEPRDIKRVLADPPPLPAAPDDQRDLDQLELQSARPGSIPGRVGAAVMGATSPTEAEIDAFLAKPNRPMAPSEEEIDAFLAKKQPAAAAEPPGAGATAALNLANSLSLVGVPNVLAAQDAVRHLGEGDFGTNFRKARGVYKAQMERTNAAHPKAAIAGNLGTLLVGGNPEGLGQLAVTAAAQGGLQSDELAHGDLAGALRQGAGTGLLTAGAGAALEGAGNVAGKVAAPITRKVGQALENSGASNFVKALGVKKMAPEAVQKLGRLVARNGVVPFGAARGSEAIAKNAAEILGEQGPEIGRILEQANADAAKAGQKFDWGSVLMRLNKLRDSLNTTEARQAYSAIGQQTGGYAPTFFDDIAQEAAKGGGFDAANKAKTSIADSVNWSQLGGDTPVRKRIAKQMVGVMNDEIEKQLEQHSGPEAAEAFKTSKTLFGGATEAKKHVDKLSAGKIGHQVAAYGLPAMLGGALVQTGHGGLESGGAALGAAVAMKTLKAARDRAPAVLGPLEMSAGAALKRAALSQALRGGNLMPLLGGVGRSAGRAAEPEAADLAALLRRR